MRRLLLIPPLLCMALLASAGPIVPGFPWSGGNGTSGQVLTSNGANLLPSFQAGGGGGSGTVTSVALSDASSTAIYVIGGSPCTTACALTITLATETPNFVLAGPASGVTAVQPTFRALNATDLTAALVSPPAIGGTTPAAGSFTTLAASSTVSGTGFSTYLASPPAIGGSAAAAGAFTTLSASSTVSGTGFSTYLASPPAIGGSAAAAGTFTTLTTGGAVALTASPVTISGNISSATGNANGYGLIGTATPNYTDTSAAGGTIANAYMYSLPAPNLETTTTTTYTNVATLNIPVATCSVGGGATPTCTNRYAIMAGGGIDVTTGFVAANGSGIQIGAGLVLAWTGGHGSLSSAAAGTINFGAAASGAATAYTLTGNGSTGSNIVGGSLTIEPGPGTGNSTPSTLTLSTPHVGTTGSTVQSLNAQIVMGDNTVAMPNIASSSAATTGTVCWTTSTGNLTVDTTLACLSSLGAWKKDIEPLDSGLSEVMQLKPVSYDLKPEYDPEHLGRQVGFLAEDVEQVDKRLVGYGGDGQLRGVRYMQMAALLTKGEQELVAQVSELRAQNAALEARLERLEHAKR